ncbi:MAG TPA: amidohydrolase family protein [Pirellulales bacterium]|jgi:N-acetylglucosamine-6-phosphate deacetylase
MSTDVLFVNGDLVLSDRVQSATHLLIGGARIVAIGPDGDHPSAHHAQSPSVGGAHVIDARDHYIVPGYVDLHVHGGAGADFMDGTAEAFYTIRAAHARHGTTSLLPTSTAARPEQILAMLTECSRQRLADDGRGARVLGAHLYGPYFRAEARGCHPGDGVRPPVVQEYEKYLELAAAIATASVAPELPGAEAFARACVARGIRMNAGHSHATFEQAEQAIGWGVRHVDHLFCAMSDRARLRQSQPFPMRGGLLEATLYFDELTTEVIADGRHLAPELLRLAYKVKGPDRLALVTDANRALDMPDGPYMFGPRDGGEPILRRDDVGLMPDGQALASGVQGMDHLVRTFIKATGCPLWEVVRMASLTSARIAGWDHELGSIAVGKRADLLLLDRALNVRQVFLGGQRFAALP